MRQERQVNINQRQGFTIVELLIVIVVIAILAAITVVAYNGVQDRAKNAIAKSDVRNLGQAAQIFRTQNGHYPAVSNNAYASDLEEIIRSAGLWGGTRLDSGSVERVFAFCGDADGTRLIVIAWGVTVRGINLENLPNFNGMNIDYWDSETGQVQTGSLNTTLYTGDNEVHVSPRLCASVEPENQNELTARWSYNVPLSGD